MEKKPASPWRKVMVAAALLMFAAIGQFVYTRFFGVANDFIMAETGVIVSYDFSRRAQIHAHGTRNFYLLTRDGMQYLTLSGDERWNHTFNLASPEMSARGEIAAVAEPRGRQVWVFNPGGLLYTETLPDPLLHFNVNETGYLAAAVQMERGYAVLVYGPSGGAPIYRYRIQDQNVFPTAMEVSPDGRFIAIALMDTRVRLQTSVVFGNINAFESRGVPDGIFAIEILEDQIAAYVRFMDGNRALIITDAGMYCFRPGANHTLDKLWSETFHNELGLIAFDGGKSFAYTTGEPLLNRPDAAPAGVLRMVGLDGRITGTFEIGRRATHLSMAHGTALAGADRTFFAVNTRGNRLWTYPAMQDVTEFIFIHNTDTVLLAGSTRASVMQRVRVNPTAEPDAPANQGDNANDTP
jgi:hypothetical protein